MNSEETIATVLHKNGVPGAEHLATLVATALVTGEWVEYETLFDSLPQILAALEAAEQILKRSQQISTNDSGKFRGVTTSSALIEVRAAIAKLTDGATQ